MIHLVVYTAMAIILGAALTYAGETVVERIGEVTTITQINPKADKSLDYDNAKPITPMLNFAPHPVSFNNLYIQREGMPGFEPGAQGNGRMRPETLPLKISDPEEETPNNEAGVTPQEYGTSDHPFTTSRVDFIKEYPAKLYPYSPTGKLYFKIGGDTYVCSASLIKKGIAVTAAHCVTEFGSGRYFSDWEFIPALSWDKAPYGTWNVDAARVMTSYFDGTESCAVEGVVCPNDIAVLAISPKNDEYPGTFTGWYGYGWDGRGFTDEGITQIHQLGYPVSHDRGLLMQRTDSFGYVEVHSSNNTVWGSRQTGGSSGGPELVDFGLPSIFAGISEIDFNIVVGVTSWGYIDSRVKQQGASPFTSSNIIPLVESACGAYPAACDN
jgi:V8-like Glu-specific endopeptidase